MGFFDFLTGGKNTAGDGLIKQGEGYLGQQGQIGNQYGGLAHQAGLDYQGDNANYRQSLSDRVNYLRTDPFTDSYSQAALNQATRGNQAGLLSGESNMAANLARRGMGEGPSSLATGGEAALQNQYMTNQAGAQNNLAFQKIGMQNQHQQELMGLLGGQANQDYGRQMGAMGAQNGIYGNLAQQYQNLGQQAYQRRAAQQQGLFQTLGGLAQTGMQLYGMGHNPYLSMLQGMGGGGGGYGPSQGLGGGYDGDGSGAGMSDGTGSTFTGLARPNFGQSVNPYGSGG